jgi:N-acetyltransferase 10
LREVLELPVALALLLGTASGLEGTAGSLRHKVLPDLHAAARSFLSIELSEPVRYRQGCPVEGWLNELLLLDIEVAGKTFASLPGIDFDCIPSDCELFLLNRAVMSAPDNLEFMSNVKALLQSHYRTSTADLLALLTSKSKQLFVLIPRTSATRRPVALAVVAYERIQDNPGGPLYRNKKDNVSFAIEKSFKDVNMDLLPGARVMRIVAHPNLRSRGFGSVLLGRLVEHFRCLGKPVAGGCYRDLLLGLSSKDGNLSRLHWVGVCFGLHDDIFRFWRRHDFLPVVLSHVPNPATGEFSVTMILSISPEFVDPNPSLSWRFRLRFLRSLPTIFGSLPTNLCLQLLEPISHDTALPDSVRPNLGFDILSRLTAFARTSHALSDSRGLLDAVRPTILLCLASALAVLVHLGSHIQFLRSRRPLVLTLVYCNGKIGAWH